MTRPGQSPWETVLRDLHREFSLLERELSLIQDISESILNIRADDDIKPLENLFVDAIERFSRIRNTQFPLLCYVCLGAEFVLLERQDSDVAEAITIDIPKVFKASLTGQDLNTIQVSVISRNENDALFGYFPGMKTILLCPMFSEWKQLICVFLLADTNTIEGSHLSDQAFRNSVVSLVSQLAIAYKHHDRALQHGWIKNLWNAFLEWNLSPTACFKEMARQIPSFLPTFGPIKYRGIGPEVQILTLRREPDPDSHTPEQLVIRGTTGHEHEGTKVSIERSISGLLIKSDEGKRPFFCDDVTKPKYKKLYRKYLGNGKTIRTELAVRLSLQGQPVGVLNLESEEPDAFNVHHVAAVLRLSEMIAPVVMVLERRLGMNSKMQMSVASSTARYLDGIASVYRHSMQTPLAAMRANIEMASDVVQSQVVTDLEQALKLASTSDNAKLVSILNRITENVKRTGPPFKRLLATHSQISNYNADFLSDVSSYSESGPMDLRATVNAAVKLVTDSLLARLGQQVRIEFVADETTPTTRVHCSPLLKQHLYSIFHNAVLAIQERHRKDPGVGIISIAITKGLPPPSQEVQLNTSWAVSIRDNGIGVKPDQLERLQRIEPGVRFRKDGGQGSGLVAAERFMTSIGGRLELNSEFEKGFEVILHLSGDRPNI